MSPLLLAPLVKGLVLGLSIAAPVGPIGLLCIRKTLTESRAAGLACGAGAAAADAVYGLVAALGLSAATSLLTGHKAALQVVGGLALAWIGARTFLAKPAATAAKVEVTGLVRDFAATFALTLTNPATILSYLAVFAGLGVGLGYSQGEAVVLVAGVFTGSLAWWLFLTTTLSLARRWATPERMAWINRLAGLGLIGFGVWIFAGLFRP